MAVKKPACSVEVYRKKVEINVLEPFKIKIVKRDEKTARDHTVVII
jgi:hypothetical protein